MFMERIHTLAETTNSPPPRVDPIFSTAHAPSSAQRGANEQALLSQLERQKHTFDLAMAASKMGTWRYTLADNICQYDENAQRLYGLEGPRFLHDAEGVKSKFHADDMDLLWSRVAAALDPNGDGRYNVEYRVKQLDGSWRWLSAWGQVEFVGEGPDRQAVAITGASRDLTERKEAEALQRLLLDELQHRVKNTLATIQAITVQTLNSARDLPSAKDALVQRIVSMAKAHDLLIAGSWTGANVRDIVRGVIKVFSPDQVDLSGIDVDLSSKQTLALSMALHELATNATKYGALSCSEGRVSVRWEVRGSTLQLDWEESGGPAVTSPGKKGFGSRLLERLLSGELGGKIQVDYPVTGVRCRVTAIL
jgi:two-component sensor histidine kinase/PAS domain-containing protein